MIDSTTKHGMCDHQSQEVWRHIEGQLLHKFTPNLPDSPKDSPVRNSATGLHHGRLIAFSHTTDHGWQFKNPIIGFLALIDFIGSDTPFDVCGAQSDFPGSLGTLGKHKGPYGKFSQETEVA